MALPQVISTVKNFLGTKVILPRTVTKAVYDNDGVCLDEVIDDIKTDLTNKCNIQSINGDLYTETSGHSTELKLLIKDDSSLHLGIYVDGSLSNTILLGKSLG